MLAQPSAFAEDVPIIGSSVIDASPIEHGCEPTGDTLRGSTHAFEHFRDQYEFAGTVPDLPEVRCARAPTQIVGRSIEWEAVGAGRAYYIQFWVEANAEGIGRYDIGGTGAACYRTFRGLAWYRTQVEPGEVVGSQCFSLGDKYYDARAELEKVIDNAVVCRVVFLDTRGMKGEYATAWYNRTEPVCDNLRAIDPRCFAKRASGIRTPYRLTTCARARARVDHRGNRRDGSGDGSDGGLEPIVAAGAIMCHRGCANCTAELEGTCS